MRFTRREGCYVLKEIRRPAHVSQARAVPTKRMVGKPEVGHEIVAKFRVARDPGGTITDRGGG